jgi:hypothetical protein
MLHTERPGILYIARSHGEFARKSPNWGHLTSHCNRLFLWEDVTEFYRYLHYDGSFDGPRVQFLWWTVSKKKVKARNLQNTNRKLLWLKIWRDSGSNDTRTGQREKQDFFCEIFLLFMSWSSCTTATYGKLKVWGLSWNWYYLIVCRMVDSTYKCGPLCMYRYVSSK